MTCGFRRLALVALLLATGLGFAQEGKGGADAVESRFQRQRELMVDRQLRSRGIKDEKVLRSIGRVLRHRLVPERYRRDAYDDSPLPIGEGQTISQPYIVALMTELLQLSTRDRVLEVGTGSGYQAAVLAEIVKEVYSVEIFPRLHELARENLRKLGYQNIHLRHGDPPARR